jgi:hypothetical protein
MSRTRTKRFFYCIYTFGKGNISLYTAFFLHFWMCLTIVTHVQWLGLEFFLLGSCSKCFIAKKNITCTSSRVHASVDILVTSIPPRTSHILAIVLHKSLMSLSLLDIFRSCISLGSTRWRGGIFFTLSPQHHNCQADIAFPLGSWKHVGIRLFLIYFHPWK